MKKLFIFLCILSSCTNEPGSAGALDSHLDKEITERLSWLGDTTNSQSTLVLKNVADAGAIHRDAEKMYNSITVYDKCEKELPAMDAYFKAQGQSLKIGEEALIRLASLDSKPEIKMAIKLNELALLDRMLYKANRVE